MPNQSPSTAAYEAAKPQEAPKSHSFPIHKVYKVFQDHFRPKRKRAFVSLFPEVAAGSPVLDVGGTANWWKEDFPKDVNISIVNIDDDHRQEVTENGFTFYKADGRKLPFADKEFYLTFSNSVIEHVGDLEDQKRFASEAMRCGQKLYLQTPSKWFPIEPHLITAFLHWLPFKVARRLLRHFSIWGLVAKPSQQQIDEFLRTTRLLTRREIKEIFPDAQIREEKFLGLTKSFIVINR
jgi:ubiquinone/menaquinone biosynthesis C-methylase UbiE